jgi:hypothetical protein
VDDSAKAERREPVPKWVIDEIRAGAAEWKEAANGALGDPSLAIGAALSLTLMAERLEKGR